MGLDYELPPEVALELDRLTQEKEAVRANPGEMGKSAWVERAKELGNRRKVQRVRRLFGELRRL